MYFGSVTSLLRAIGRDRHVNTVIESAPQRDGANEYTVTARSANGELWRSHHTDLLLAVVMLERLMQANGTSDDSFELPHRSSL